MWALYVAVQQIRGLAMGHTDNLGLVQSIQGCAECCIEPGHKDIDVRET